MDVALLYFDGCPHWETAERILTDVAAEFDLTVSKKRVRSSAEADDLGFRGSPTLLVDGVDPFADPDAPTGLSCRLYLTPEGLRGSPTADMLRSVLSG